MIGLHLMVDGIASALISKEQIEEILSELPASIGMKILSGPFVVRGHPENPGWTGFVIIDKSHISIHTFDEGNLVSVDIFSCKTFDKNEVHRFLKQKLVLKETRLNLIVRTI